MKRTIIVLSMLALGAMSAQANLISGGEFEYATTSPWAVSGGLTLSISTASANSGSQSAQIDFPTTDLGGIRQGIFITPADRLLTYTFSFSVNVEATGFSTIFGIRPAVGEWNQVVPITYHYGDIVWVQPGTTGWVTYTQTFTLTLADATYLMPRIYTYPVGVAGSVLLDDILLEAEVAIEPFPVIDAPDLLVNGGFTQATNQVPDDGGPWWTVDGSLSDWAGFWGRNADLTGWSHYHADPNNHAADIGTTNNPSLSSDGSALDGTDKFNTDFNTTDGLLNLNSSGEYRNGMMQTLGAVTIDPELTYELTVDVKKNSTHDHSSATFTMALTSGSSADATNLANAVTGGLLQIPVTNLTTAYASQTLQISGTALTGQLNVLVENLNTEAANATPVDSSNVSQVTIDGITLSYPIPEGDVNKDGVVDQDDVDLANSYLDGSVDGGDDAATRIAAQRARGYTTAEALDFLNLTDFDIDGNGDFDADDVTAVENLVPLVIASAAMDGSGNFDVDLIGVIPGRIYYLKRSSDLVNDSITNVVGSVTSAWATASMTDTNPPAGQAFYQVTAQGGGLPRFTLWQLPRQGASVLAMSYVIKSAGGRVVVIDGGTAADGPYLKSFLEARGNHVDSWFITHSHYDHIGALTWMLSNQGDLEIDKIYASFSSDEWIAENYDSPALGAYQAFTNAMAVAGRSHIDLDRGDLLDIDEISIEIVADETITSNLVANAVNDSSIVMRFSDPIKTVLFTGDIGPAAGDAILAAVDHQKLKADYVQMAHHGQACAGENFYQVVLPEYCLWPTPLYLWNNDVGGGYNTGPYGTITTRQWMEDLNVKSNYVSGVVGLVKIK